MRQGRLSLAGVALCLAGLFSLALACDSATAPDIGVPPAAVSLTAPARFAVWWRLTQTCAATTGNFAAVSWYVVPNTTTITYQGKQVDAYWIGNPDRIVLADARKNDGPIVRHEMLHVLLHRNGHPRDAFLTACGGVVACDGECAIEAGGYAAPPTTAPELQPSDVGTRVDVIPSLPAEVATGTPGGTPVAAMVTITNPRSEPVWVRLTPRESGDFVYQTFGIIVDNDASASIAALLAESAPTDRFALGAGESRHWVWDGTLGNGRFGIRGFFNVDSAARQVISIGQ